MRGDRVQSLEEHNYLAAIIRLRLRCAEKYSGQPWLRAAGLDRAFLISSGEVQNLPATFLISCCLT